MSAPETLQLNCPKCNGSIRVLTSSMGKRVRCPRCQAAFKIPGQAAVERNDDDWLNLDDSAEGAPQPKPTASPPSGAGAAWAPERESINLSPPEDDEGLDSFMLKSEELPPPPEPKNQSPTAPPRQAGFSDADMKALNSILKEPHRSGATSSGREGSRGNDAGSDDLVGDLLDEKEAISEFRVTCPICSSLTYARTDQVGTKVKCSDCYTMMTIPPPPKIRKAYSPDIENAETYALVDSGEASPIYEGPMAKSAAELLRAAEESSDSDQDREPNYDNPDVMKWLGDIFGIFRDPSVPLHLLVLSLLGMLPAIAAVIIANPGFSLVSTMLTAIYFAVFVLPCAFSILESVANGEKEVSEWSYMQPGEWLGRMLIAVAAASLAGGPAAFLGDILFGPSLAMVALTMLSLYIFFPFVLLSMLDSESVLVPFSPEVSKSVTRCQEAWGVLYLSAGLLFFGLLVFYVATNLLPPVATAVFAAFGTVGALFTYFSMIGRLAYAIGHAVNAPPMKNDIDKIRAKERAERKAEES